MKNDNLEIEFEPYDDNKAYDFYWNDLTPWEFNYKYNFSDEFIEKYGKPQV